VSALPASVREAVRRLGIGPGQTVLAAVSGGPDSTAMLRALAAVRAERGYALAACVVDHRIRPAADIGRDLAFLRRLCGSVDVPLVVKAAADGECESRAKATGAGLEETARDLRHSLLRQAARETGADLIALGHTQDDVIETLLMRLLQGSDVHGLRGIPFRRGPFFRPLLACSRRQVVSWLQSLGQDWREDATNRDTGILRNRVRHRLLPVLEAEFPGFRRGLAMLSQKLALSSDLARKLAGSLPWRAGGECFSVDAAAFFAAPPAVRAWSLLSLYDRFRLEGRRRRLPWRFLAPALRPGVPPASRTILRGHGVVLAEDKGTLTWGRDIASRRKKGYFIVVSEARSAEIREAAIRVCIASGPGERGGHRGGIVILAEKVKPPFVLRSKKKGDSILLAGGTTSVKELLIGMKVPEFERHLVPILSDRSGVLAVLGGPLGYRTRTREGILASDAGAEDRIRVIVQGGREERREQ
jgi:tRNA(Ile)-lysidine synthase